MLNGGTTSDLASTRFLFFLTGASGTASTPTGVALVPTGRASASMGVALASTGSGPASTEAVTATTRRHLLLLLLSRLWDRFSFHRGSISPSTGIALARGLGTALASAEMAAFAARITSFAAGVGGLPARTRGFAAGVRVFAAGVAVVIGTVWTSPLSSRSAWTSCPISGSQEPSS